MNVQRLSVGELQANCWIVSDGLGGPGIVIDPGGDAPAILEGLAGTPVAAIVLTHAHFDHIGAARELVRVTGAPLVAHELDAPRLTTSGADGTGGALFGFDHTAPAADRTVVDGDLIAAGALSLEVLHTPGHTGGCICLFVSDPQGGAPQLFSGDTLFAGSVGRTDFPGGDGRALSASIATKLAPLPAETVVHPGHGPDTTISREARVNPFWPRA